MLGYTRNDGGRADAGFKGSSGGDCAVRAICIAMERPYRAVYRDLGAQLSIATGGMDRSPRNGVWLPTFHSYMVAAQHRAWHLVRTDGEYMTDQIIPHMGTVVAVLNHHYVTIINGQVNDSWDSRKDRRTKCGAPKILGYYARY